LLLLASIKLKLGIELKSKGFVISLVKLSKRRNGKGGCPWWHFFYFNLFFKKIAKITCGRKYFQNLARFAAPRAMAPQHRWRHRACQRGA
jgi:hypothetical protein